MSREEIYSPGLDKDFLNALYNGLSEAVLAVGLNTRRIVYWGKGAEVMFGYSAPEVLGRTTEFLYPDYVSFQRIYHIGTPVIREQGCWHTEWEYQRRDGSCFPAEVTLTTFLQTETDVYVVSVIRDVTERRRAEVEIRARVRQQAVAAELGQRALAGTDLSVLMDEAVVLIAQTLGVEYCKVLELLPDGNFLLLRAGVGWQEGLVGQATVGAGTDSQAGYTLLSSEPVMVEDLRTETRFSGPPLLHEHGVVSGMSVIIHGQDRPFGVLGMHTTARRTFSPDDIHFLQAVANVLAEAVKRQRAEEAVRRNEAWLGSLINTTQDAVISIDRQGRIVLFNPAAERIFGYTKEEVQGHKVTLLMPQPYASES
jgi:PAS domain S-box-containing protein